MLKKRSLPTADSDNVVNPDARKWPLHSLGDFEQINATSDACVSYTAKQSLQSLESWLFQRKAMDY